MTFWALALRSCVVPLVVTRVQLPSASEVHACDSLGVPETAVCVPYLALIAFLAECCRFAIRSAEVCYTGNSANHWPRIFTPHPAQGPISYPASTPPPLMPVES